MSGFPSVGKSSLLKALTNANPKIAAYPFTTKIPNLGMLRLGEKDVVLADIPGIIEGASTGLGLGFRFLKHIARTACLAFLIDLGEPDFTDTYAKLLVELEAYNPDLLEKKRLIIGTKMDLECAEENLAELKKMHPEHEVIAVSVFSRVGIGRFETCYAENGKIVHETGNYGGGLIIRPISGILLWRILFRRRLFLRQSRTGSHHFNRLIKSVSTGITPAAASGNDTCWRQRRLQNALCFGL